MFVSYNDVYFDDRGRTISSFIHFDLLAWGLTKRDAFCVLNKKEKKRLVHNKYDVKVFSFKFKFKFKFKYNKNVFEAGEVTLKSSKTKIIFMIFNMSF